MKPILPQYDGFIISDWGSNNKGWVEFYGICVDFFRFGNPFVVDGYADTWYNIQKYCGFNETVSGKGQSYL